MGKDCHPHLSPNFHFNLQIKMFKRKLRSEMGLLNTLQGDSGGALSLRSPKTPDLFYQASSL